MLSTFVNNRIWTLFGLDSCSRLELHLLRGPIHVKGLLIEASVARDGELKRGVVIYFDWLGRLRPCCTTRPTPLQITSWLSGRFVCLSLVSLAFLVLKIGELVEVFSDQLFVNLSGIWLVNYLTLRPLLSIGAFLVFFGLTFAFVYAISDVGQIV